MRQGTVAYIWTQREIFFALPCSYLEESKKLSHNHRHLKQRLMSIQTMIRISCLTSSLTPKVVPCAGAVIWRP